jgi:hypothetical protein
MGLGALVFEGYGSGFNMSSTHEGISMTKALGALVAGWAAKNGLDIDKNVSGGGNYGVQSPKPYPVTSRMIMGYGASGRRQRRSRRDLGLRFLRQWRLVGLIVRYSFLTSVLANST